MTEEVSAKAQAFAMALLDPWKMAAYYDHDRAYGTDEFGFIKLLQRWETE